MKVIHILNELKFSGAEIMYVDAAPVFRELGCELSVVATAARIGEFTPGFEQAGYEVLHWPYPASLVQRWRYYRRAIGFLREGRFDVVHTHVSTLKWSMAFCAWRAGCRSVYTFHSVFRSHWYSYWYHRWLRWSAKRIFGCRFQSISASVRDNEKNYYHNDTQEIYNWYSSERFYPASAEEKVAIRHELQLPEGALVLISVGGCSPIKRHTEIIEALREIVAAKPNVVYLHLGEGISLSTEQELAEQSGVSGHIRWLGNRRDVRKHLIAADIYMMPSRHEGISLTTIEAMACGIPAILYDVPGLRDFNRTQECAMLIPEDSQRLAEEVIALSSDSTRWEQLAHTARGFVNSSFDMRTNAMKIMELYVEQ